MASMIATAASSTSLGRNFFPHSRLATPRELDDWQPLKQRWRLRSRQAVRFILLGQVTLSVLLVSFVLPRVLPTGSDVRSRQVELGRAPRLVPGSYTGPFVGAARLDQSDSGLLVDTSDRAAGVDFYNRRFVPPLATSPGWTGSVDGCNPGATSAEYESATITMVNFYRAMAGLPANVQLLSNISEKDQRVALMILANSAMSHRPPASWTCATPEGLEAAAHSLQAHSTAYRAGVPASGHGPQAIVEYLYDDGDNNTAVDHRRWVLYPPTTIMGTGSGLVSGRGTQDGSNALWVTANYGGERPAGPDFVAWPAAGFMPYPILSVPTASWVAPQALRWSLAQPETDFSNAVVHMTEQGRPVPLRIVYRNAPDDRMSADPAIVWQPEPSPDFGPGMADRTFEVTVTGALVGRAPHTYQYRVTVIDPASVSP